MRIKIFLGSAGSGKTAKIKDLMDDAKYNFLYLGFLPIGKGELKKVESFEHYFVYEKKSLDKSYEIVLSPLIKLDNCIQLNNLEKSSIIIDDLFVLRCIKDYKTLFESNNNIILCLETFSSLKKIDPSLYYYLLKSEEKEILLFPMYNGLEAEDYEQLFYDRYLFDAINEIKIGEPVQFNSHIAVINAFKPGVKKLKRLFLFRK